MTDPKKSDDNRKHTADTRNPGWDKYAPEGHGHTDEQVRADVHEALRGADVKDASALSISVGDGIVTLGGRVASQDEQQRIEQLLSSIPSVKEVRNDLSVGGAKS